jgi:hypothetical protein
MDVTKMYIALRLRRGGLIWSNGTPQELLFSKRFIAWKKANRSIRYHILDRRMTIVAPKCF